MITREISLERDHESHNFLAIDLHPAADVLIRRSVQHRRFDQVLPPRQDSGARRTAQRLAAAEAHQIGAHGGERGQVAHRRQLTRCIDQHGHVRLLPDSHQLLQRDNTGARTREAGRRAQTGKARNHRRGSVDRADQLLFRLDVHYGHAGRAIGAVVHEPMRLLHEADATRPGGMGKGVDPSAIGPRQACGGAEHHAAGSARGDHGRLGLHDRRDATAGSSIELVEVDEELARLGHRANHVGPHARVPVTRQGTGRANDGCDPEQLRVDVVAVCGLDALLRRLGTAATHSESAEQAGHQRALEEVTARPPGKREANRRRQRHRILQSQRGKQNPNFRT